MAMIDTIKILAAIGKVQDFEEIFTASSNYHVTRVAASCDAHRVIKLDDYNAANLVAQLLNDAYNTGKRVALQELAKELTSTSPHKDWLEKKS